MQTNIEQNGAVVLWSCKYCSSMISVGAVSQGIELRQSAGSLAKSRQTVNRQSSPPPCVSDRGSQFLTNSSKLCVPVTQILPSVSVFAAPLPARTISYHKFLQFFQEMELVGPSTGYQPSPVVTVLRKPASVCYPEIINMQNHPEEMLLVLVLQQCMGWQDRARGQIIQAKGIDARVFAVSCWWATDFNQLSVVSRGALCGYGDNWSDRRMAASAGTNRLQS